MVVVPAKAGHVVVLFKPRGATVSAIQTDTRCWIKCGTAGLVSFVAWSIIIGQTIPCYCNYEFLDS
jgi:hypothetical protein